MALLDNMKKCPYGFGLSLFMDFTKNLGKSCSKQRVAEAVVGRLIDELWFEPDYGINLPQKLRRFRQGIDQPYLRQLEQEIILEVLKDDRVEDATCSIETVGTSATLRVGINLAEEPNEGFELIGQFDLIKEEITFEAQ